MQKILCHYHPGTEFDLPTLRALASQCDNDQPLSPPFEAPDNHAKMVTEPIHNGASMNLMTIEKEEDSAVQEIVQLHQNYGCMMADAHGEYREYYMLAQSRENIN